MKSRPITPTPSLNEKEWRRFMDRVEQDLKKPTGPVPTPRLEEAIKMVMADARRRKKIMKPTPGGP